MSPESLSDALQRAAASGDFLSEAERLFEQVDQETATIGAVEVVLRFLEGHPSLDFGAPGPLVHFAESFYGRGYESLLVESLSRRPVAHTVWMLNRVINGSKDATTRARLTGVMRSVGRHPHIDSEASSMAGRFLGRLE